MITYDYVEDYLEAMAGKRDLRNNHSMLWISASRPLISLARYDVAFLDSVTDSTILGTAMTDRQAELAIKLLIKYQRQLAAKGLHVDPTRLPKFRYPLRTVDRTRRAWIEDGMIQVRFPYDGTMIADFKELSKTSQGRVFYTPDLRLWRMDITEYNVNWLVSWAAGRDFSLSADLQDMQSMILQVESVPYRIRLTRQGNDIVIENAEHSLLEYLEQQGVKLCEDHLLLLADWSSVLGYEVDDSIWRELEQQVPTDIFPFVRERAYQLSGDVSQLDRVRRYARLVNREPVVIFDPSAGTSSYEYYKKHWDGEVTRLGNQQMDIHQHRAVYSDRTVPVTDCIPLLISHVGLVAGTHRTMMVQSSQKIVYFNRKL